MRRWVGDDLFELSANVDRKVFEVFSIDRAFAFANLISNGAQFVGVINRIHVNVDIGRGDNYGGRWSRWRARCLSGLLVRASIGQMSRVTANEASPL